MRAYAGTREAGFSTPFSRPRQGQYFGQNFDNTQGLDAVFNVENVMQLRAGIGSAGFGVGHARFERRVHLHIGHIVAELHSGFLIDIEQVVAKHFAHAHYAGIGQLCDDEIDKFRSTSHGRQLRYEESARVVRLRKHKTAPALAGQCKR